MAQKYQVIPPIFTTEDGLVRFFFSAGEDNRGFKPELQITAEITTVWDEPESVPDPRTVQFTASKPARMAFIYDNGNTLDGQLSLRDGQQWIWGDFFYGEQDEHHFIGTMAAVVAIP